jgi:ABC-type uncharacterized transport system auxiliary subunit
MKRTVIPIAVLLAMMAIMLSGCFSKVDRMVTNYYILDYKKDTENPSLRMNEPFPKTVEVLDSEITRTYGRNQLVVKENFTRVRYLPWDVWANRLADAVPNIITQRLKAYNIFKQVDRSTGDITPDYYLETMILNLEKIESETPKAHLRMEFYLRDSNSQKILLSHADERYMVLDFNEIVTLVEAYNSMIMTATDVFAAKCRLFMEGKPIFDTSPQTSIGPVEQFLYEQIEITNEMVSDGELLLNLVYDTGAVVSYAYQSMEEQDGVILVGEGTFGTVETLPPGKYRITFGEDMDLLLFAEVKPKLRTIIRGEWTELIVSVINESQTKVRVNYDIWKKALNSYEYYQIGSDTSVGDEDLGKTDKVWLLTPGTYMVKLGGGSWNDLRNFTTVSIQKGESKLLTVVVDPSSDRNILVGAGVLGNKELALRRNDIHKGALHGNISLVANNSVAEDDPVVNLTITGQTDNSFNIQFGLLHLTSRSLYDLGLNLSTGNDLRISNDDYSLKNVLLFTPVRSASYLRNFSFYGRAELNSHFFDRHHYYSSVRNVALFDEDGDLLNTYQSTNKVKSNIALFPMRLKEGTGITYRLIFDPQKSLSIRAGYGWQQEISNRNFIMTGTDYIPALGDSLVYDIYTEQGSTSDSGIESTLVFAASNLFKFVSINSTLDVLFPVFSNSSTRFESDNRLNLKLYRNISMDIKLNMQYDQTKSDRLLYDYGTYLRFSLYY